MMRQMNPPYYSEKTKLELLRMAPPEKLIEYLLLHTRKKEGNK